MKMEVTMLGKLIGKGRTASVYAFGVNKVIKLFNEDIPKSWIEHEYRINMIANTFHCNSPKVFEMVKVENKMGIVFEAIEGVTVTEILSKPPFKTEAIANEVALVHAGIHKACANELEEQLEYYGSRINRTEELSEIQKEKIIDYLKTLPNDNKLCHGDLHSDNYLVQEDNYYVIDWTNAYMGHPASDVARTILMMKSPYGKTMVPPELKSDIDRIINNYLETFLKSYLEVSAFGKEIIDAWLLPVAAARLIETVPYEREWLIGIIEEELKKIQHLK